MIKNVVIVFLVILVILMFIANYRNVKTLVEETKKRIYNQAALANLMETSSSSTEKPVVNPSVGAVTA